MRHQVEHEKGNSTAGKAEKEKHVAESELGKGEGEGGENTGSFGILENVTDWQFRIHHEAQNKKS